jgi:hypothetical protein
MRFTLITAGLFGMVSLVAAQGPAPNACCCCDISKNVISCNRNILKEDCMCAAVVCPANARTIYNDGMPPPTQTVVAKQGPPSVQKTEAPVAENGEATGTEDACCCCNIAMKKIVCSRSISKHDCICPAVMCPSGAKTIWADDDKRDMARASPSLLSERKSAMNEPPRRFVTVRKPEQRGTVSPGLDESSSANGRMKLCCCCNPRSSKVVCDIRAQGECVCLAVACPKDAETVYVKSECAKV